MGQKYILTTHQLSKHYKGCKAVDNVDMHVKEGEIYGFIGKNGAGKSTCLKMFSGLIHPTAGHITLFGHEETDFYTQNCFARIGSLIEMPGLYLGFSAYDNLRLLSLYSNCDKNRIEEVLKIVGLENVASRKVKNYSLGMKQRLGIALALLSRPDLLILDEPINGLDPQGIAEIRETLLTLNRKEGTTIIISSHILEELSKIATTFGIIHNGKLLEELSAQEFEKKCTGYIEVTVDNPAETEMVLKTLPCSYTYTKNTFRVTGNITSGNLATNLINHHIVLQDIHEQSISLEDYYFSVTKG